MTCPACDGETSRALGAKNGFLLRDCDGCGALFVDPSASPDADPAALYAQGYAEEEAMPSLVAASLETLVRGCESFRRTGRWLDVGYGQGDLLAIASAHLWSCYGTEVAQPALARARQRGWTVAEDADADPRFVREGFDVVTMIELLEHVPRPRRFLRAAAAWLRPGGLLYVTTPNARSLNRRALGLGWSVVVPPEHLTLFSARALSAGLAEAGFGRVRLRTEGLNPYEILARLKRPGGRDGAGPAFNRNESAQQLAAALSGGTARRALKTGINRCLSLLRLGDTLKAWAVRDHARRGAA